MYGEHVYARPTRGTESSIARITVEDLRGVVAQRFGRDRLFVGVVGDITPDALGKVLDDTFLALPEKAAPFEIGKAKVQNKGETVVIASRSHSRWWRSARKESRATIQTTQRS